MERGTVGVAVVAATITTLLSFGLFGLDGAFAYPADGSNHAPTQAWGGLLDEFEDLALVPRRGNPFVVTDILMANQDGSCELRVDVLDDAGTVLAQIVLDGDKGKTFAHSFNSGLPFESGSAIHLSEEGRCRVRYTVSGFFVH